MSKHALSVLKRRGRATITVLLALALLTFGPMLVFAASGDELWVARQPSSSGEIDIALDGAGNVYTAGASYSETSTVPGYSVNKYDANGALLWSRNYISEPYGSHAYAIAVGGNGNAYVTGQGAGGITTVKYSPEGTLAWSATNSQGVFGNDIAVDGAGNVYVTGSRTQYGGGGDESDYVTIKYDNNGAEKWVKTYNGPGNGNDEATGIGLDAAGNIYVAGHSQGVSGRAYAIIKYMPDGKQKWVARYDAVSATTQLYADTLSVDADGNAAVTGGVSPDNNWLTVLYDTHGHLQWASRYPGGDGQSVKMDSVGNVVVAGYVNGASNMATVKYDVNTGRQIWASIFNITGIYTWGWKLALDAADNIYVAGGMDNQYINDTLTVKYDEAGVEQWHRSYDAGYGGNDWVESIAVNGSGVYVAGRSSRPGAVGETVVIKYEP